MPPRTLRLTDPVEALVVEQALALVRQLRHTCAAEQRGPGRLVQGGPRRRGVQH